MDRNRQTDREMIDMDIYVAYVSLPTAVHVSVCMHVCACIYSLSLIKEQCKCQLLV